MKNEGRIVLRIRQYCVYRHVVDGEVIYVGMGTAERPFRVCSNDRAPGWTSIMCSASAVEVQIVGWYSRQAEALAAEKAEIKLLRPRGNRQIPKERDESLLSAKARTRLAADRAAYLETSRLLEECASVRLEPAEQ